MHTRILILRLDLHCSAAAVAAFYESQNAVVERFQQIDLELQKRRTEEPAPGQCQTESIEYVTPPSVDFAIRASLALTFLLICLKTFAAVWWVLFSQFAVDAS